MATKKRLTYTHDEVQALLDRIIEVIKVNGVALPLDNREVDVPVPTKLSDLGEFLLEFQDGTIEFTNGAIVLSDPYRESIVTITNEEISLWRTGDREFKLHSSGELIVGSHNYWIPTDGQGSLALRSDINTIVYSRTFPNTYLTDLNTISGLYNNVKRDIEAGKTVILRLTDITENPVYFLVSFFMKYDEYIYGNAYIDGDYYLLELRDSGACSITRKRYAAYSELPRRLKDLYEYSLSSALSIMRLSPEGVDVDGDVGSMDLRETHIAFTTGAQDRTELTFGGKIKYHNATYQLPGKNAADSGTLATMEKLDADNIAYIGDEVGQGVVPVDFNPYTDTVWNKAQVLSPSQQETVRQNIGIDMTKVLTTDDEIIFDCGTSTT